MDGLEVGTKYPAMWSLTPDKHHEAWVPGLFWIEPEDGDIRAAAHRSFNNQTSSFLVDRAPQIPMLYGDVMGRRVTLISCTMDSSTGSLTHSMTNSLYSARRAIIGNVWPAVDSEPTFDEVMVVFWDQEAWADLPRIDTQMNLGGPFVFTNPRIEPDILLSAPAQLSLEDEFSFSSTDQDGYLLTPGSVFRLKLPEAQSYAELKANWLMPLQFLILLSTSRRTGIRSLRVRNSTWEPGWRDEPEWMEIRVQFPVRPKKPLSTATVLHRRQDFTKENFEKLINAVKANRFAVDQYAGVRSGFSGGRLTQFVAVAEALEALDRVAHPDKAKSDQAAWADKAGDFLLEQGARSNIRSRAKHAILNSHWSGLPHRLSRMNKETGKWLDSLVHDPNWPKMVADARNIVAHGLESTEKFQNDETGIYVAGQMCLLLFDLRFLVMVGFTPDQASALVTRRAWQAINAMNIRDNYPALLALVDRGDV